jgi:ABC-type amino acid transport substrate-binding protein
LAAAALLLAAAGSLASCAAGGTHLQRVRAWFDENGIRGDARLVIADAAALRRAAASGTAKQLRTVCGALSTDAGTLYGTLTSPDHRLTRELAQSMESFFTAAEKCAVAPSTAAPAARAGLAGARTGLSELSRARRLLQALGLRHPW